MSRGWKAVALVNPEEPGIVDRLDALRSCGIDLVEIQDPSRVTEFLDPSVGAVMMVASGPRLAQWTAQLARADRPTTPFLGGTLDESTAPAQGQEWIEALDEGLALVAADGRIVRCNDRFAAIFATSHDQLCGRRIAELIPDLASSTPENGQESRLNWQDRDHRYQVHMSPAAGPQGSLVSSVVQVHDMTREHALESQAREAHEAVQAAQARLIQMEREFQSVRRFLDDAPPPGAVGSALAQERPDQYAEFLADYTSILAIMVRESGYRVDPTWSESLQELAMKMGLLHSGPRDVIDLHCDALRSTCTGPMSARLAQRAEEARLLVLELMGYLLSYYRERGPSGHCREQSPGLAPADREDE